MELIYIEWEDASAVDATTGWVFRVDAREAAKPHIFRQVGFVTEVNLEAVVLTEAYSEDQISTRTRIPLGMIRRWVDLDKHVKAKA